MPNLTSWKAYACVLLVTTVPLAVQLASIWLGRPVSFTSAALLFLSYAWLLTDYTIPFFTSPFHHVPEAVPQRFFLAHGLDFFKRPPASKFQEHVQNTPNTGLIRLRGFFHRSTTLLVTTPEALKEVLNDNPYDWEKPPPPRRFLERIVGMGVLVAEGAEHKRQRKSVAPAFHGSHIRNLMPLFWEKSKKFTDALYQHLPTVDTGPREGVLDIHDYAPRVTLDIIGVAGLGRDFDTLANDDDVLAKAFAEMTDTSNPRMVRYFIASMLLPPWLLQALPWSMNKTFAKILKTLRVACTELVQEKKNLSMEKGDEHIDILSIMLRQPIPFPDKVMTDQLLTFLAAGSDTTSNSLVWTCYALATHPQVQGKLRQEIKDHLEKSEAGQDPDLPGLDSLPLLNAVTNETLRVYPTAAITGRTSVKPTKIQGIDIPLGTEIIMSPWAVQRCTAVWGEDAAEWKPERWLGEGNALTGGAKNTFSFITFLHGPRSCIGQGFARSELKFLVAATVARFHMEMAIKDEVVVSAGAVTVKPKNGLKLLLREVGKTE